MARFRLIPFSLLLFGAFAFAWSIPPLVSAWEDSHDGWDDADNDDHDWDGHHDGHDSPTSDGASHVRDKLATKFDVKPRVIDRLRDRGLGYGEIDHALTLAERMPDGITRENVKQVLEMRQEQGMGWGQIAHELDTTLGAAKREFPTQPPDAEPHPEPHAEPSISTQPTSLARGSVQTASARPTSGKAMSLSRSGKSAHAKGRGAAANRQVGKSFSSSGAKSAVRMSGASGARAGGHAFGRAASSGASGSKSNGKAKGRK